MATDYESLEQQMEQLSRDLKEVTSAVTDLSIQLKDLKLGQQADIDGATNTPTKTFDYKQPQRTCGYVNWNTSHDILKTENWKKMSVFTDFCGKLERGGIPNFYTYIKMNDNKVVNEETRFPENDLYVNVNNPLVRKEILYIKELRARKPAVGLVERFLSVAKDEMHTYSSFEKKHGLKWVNPLPEASNVVGHVVETEPVKDISVATISPVENTIVTPVISDAWSLEVTKLEEADSDRTITNESLSIDEQILQEMRNTFTDILDQLSLFNFDGSVMKVMSFPINNQKRMEIIVDLLFEKALETPNYSSLYATLARKLSHLKVPSDSDPDSYVKFRGMIIQKCQVQFDSDVEIEKELADNNDHDIEDELQMKMNERKTITNSNRAVANARFIGELYKFKMLTCRIVDYCLTKLSGKLEEDKIECLCELLTTAGKQLQLESNILDKTIKDLQRIIDLKNDQISSSALFMIQDVIDLRKRGWVKAIKNVVTAFPKTLDEIQEESEKRALLIELMNKFDVTASGGIGDGNAIVSRKEVSRKDAVKNLYTVEFLKHKANSKQTQNYIKLPPKSFQNLSLLSVFEKLQADPKFRTEMLTADREVTPTYHSSNSIHDELDFTPACSRAQVPITESKMKRAVKSIIELYLINTDEDEVVADVKQVFLPQYHAAVIQEILNVAFDKTSEEIPMITKLLLHLVKTNIISSKNFVAGIKETLEFAPDLLIDIPMLYDYLGNILAPHIKHNHITIARIFELSESIISANQGHLFLKAIIESMEYTSVSIMWPESGLQFNQWMSKELVPEWIDENNFRFLVDDD